MPKKSMSDTLRQRSRCCTSRLAVFLGHHLDIMDDKHVQDVAHAVGLVAVAVLVAELTLESFMQSTR
eukprot:15624048-Heterocapsa_arctica.AAC.1